MDRRTLALWTLGTGYPWLLRGATAARQLKGVVSQEDGRPAAGAVVKIKNLGTLQIRSFIALKDGSYRFGGLNPDIEYQVWATHQGTSSDTKTVSRFDSSSEVTIYLKLK